MLLHLMRTHSCRIPPSWQVGLVWFNLKMSLLVHAEFTWVGPGSQCLKEMTDSPRVAETRAVKGVLNKHVLRTARQVLSPTEADQTQDSVQPPCISPLSSPLQPHLFWHRLHLLLASSVLLSGLQQISDLPQKGNQSSWEDRCLWL